MEMEMEAGLGGEAALGERKGGGHGGCGGMQPKYSKEGLKLFVEFPVEMEEIPGSGDRKQNLPAMKVHSIFKNISDADVISLGLNPRWARPEWLLITVMPVAPPHIRPAVALDGVSRGNDDLTHKLGDIVKANIALTHSVKKGEPSHVIEGFEALLQYHCATFVNNEQVKQTHTRTRKSFEKMREMRENERK